MLFKAENNTAVLVEEYIGTSWFKDGREHRNNNPAMIFPDPNAGMMWAKNGSYHREDGPAYVLKNSGEHWYYNGSISNSKLGFNIKKTYARLKNKFAGGNDDICG